ncbi:hypothetical protein [Fluviispira sanaruensis]|uniref:Uncharacterized protein n=1 Tax=Fluviispira sanaruensis TaxID=2493639 RepID=A0A4P2VJ00_FLUSA|nr:hypothetical protein [Fluviispira sanaruensis]BBH53153.1 hypothetical protein JCM31447_15960 [Fluviispira sanaruensis]
MKFNINFLGLRSGQTKSNVGNTDNLLEDIRNSLKNYLDKLEVVDLPFSNSNGLTQYHYTDKQSKVRNTRLMIAKKNGNSSYRRPR